MNYRFKHDKNVIRFPEGFAEEDRGLPECCKKLLALAHPAQNDSEKNDVRGIAIKISDPADIVDFRIEKCGIVGFLPNRGDDLITPQDDLTAGFIYDWQQYIQNEGVGLYTISVEFTISGIAGGYQIGVYELKQYTIPNAAGTFRSWVEFNQFYQKELIDFTGSNFRDSLRFGGFFGSLQPKTDIQNTILKGRVVEKSTRENLNQYTLETDPTCIEVTRRLQYHYLNEDKVLMSDHNQTNHDYLLFDVDVVLEEPIEINYRKGSRFADIVAVFGDRKKLDKSYYNLD